MRTIFKAFVLLMLTMLSLGAQSQNAKRLPIVRERILQAKLVEIRRSLNLDQVTMQRLRPIYIEYEKEISGVSTNNQRRLISANSDTLTPQEAERLVMVQLENAKRLIDIREKYYHKFKTVLTPQQIVRLYQTEAQIRQKVTQELRRRSMGANAGSPDHFRPV
jgi:Spy/CpxP family protein refolding chaperone